MNETNFNQKLYKIQWQKDHKKQWKVDLNINEYEELEQMLKNLNLTKAQFLRNSIEKLKKERRN